MKFKIPRIPLGIVPDGRDLHIYGGLGLVAYGLWYSPVPWLAGILVGSVLWWMGVFRFGTTHGRAP